jgi:hypothetical protein
MGHMSLKHKKFVGNITYKSIVAVMKFIFDKPATWLTSSPSNDDADNNNNNL